MKKTPDRGLSVHFMDGSSVKITFPTQTEDQYKRKLLIDEIMKQRVLIVEAEGGVHFIPFDNIKYMSVFPASEHASPGIIKGATFSE